jgi:hypothetical protein
MFLLEKENNKMYNVCILLRRPRALLLAAQCKIMLYSSTCQALLASSLCGGSDSSHSTLSTFVIEPNKRILPWELGLKSQRQITITSLGTVTCQNSRCLRDPVHPLAAARLGAPSQRSSPALHGSFTQRQRTETEVLHRTSANCSVLPRSSIDLCRMNRRAMAIHGNRLLLLLLLHAASNRRHQRRSGPA